MFRSTIGGMEIAETRDRTLLRDALRRNTPRTLYMAADLEEPFFDQCRWLVEIRGASATAVVLVFFGLETPSVLVTGAPNGLRRILDRYGPELPARYYTKLTNAQMRILSEDYRFSDIEHLDVMVLGEAIQPTPPDGVEVRLIASTDSVESILNVYRSYPGNFFQSSQLQIGVYAGAWIDGSLTAVGGTHAYAPTEGIAVLGNIATSEGFRRRGLCKAITAVLCAELKNKGCNVIGLHVASANVPAIVCYRNCGFERDHSISQMLAEKR